MPESPVRTLPSDGLSIPVDPKHFKVFMKRVAQRAEHLADSGKRLLDRHGKRLAPPVREALTQEFAALQLARASFKAQGRGHDTPTAVDKALLLAVDRFGEGIDTHLGQYRKSVAREYVEAIAWAVVLTLIIRAFIFEAFQIPTGSMIPTLQIHDHLFVNKFIYGLKIPFTRIKFFDYRAPKPGEIIVFEYPYDDDPDSSGKDLIKRVIGAPGDRVRLKDNQLYINDQPLPRHVIDKDADCGQESAFSRRCEVARECLGGVVYTTQHHVPLPAGQEGNDTPDWPLATFDASRFGPHARVYSLPDNDKHFPNFEVPPGHVLVMGDNRDNSKDGRFFGLVPFEVIKGKAGVFWWAYKDVRYLPDWSRLFRFVHEDAPGGSCKNF